MKTYIEKNKLKARKSVYQVVRDVHKNSYADASLGVHQKCVELKSVKRMVKTNQNIIGQKYKGKKE